VRFFEIIDTVLGYYPEANTALLEKAYVFAARFHSGRPRFREEPYLFHPLAVAGILTRMKLDEESIAAGLIHHVLEANPSVREEVEEEFGPNVLRIVQGVTKLSGLNFSSRKEKQTEYLRNMILALSQDVRVLLVRLADRLHDMRTLPCEGSDGQKLLARETMDIYAPLAGRLGIEWIKQELENLAFRCLDPEAYEEITRGLANTEEDRRRYTEEMILVLTANLKEYGVQGTVSGRPKHLYSIYQKMMRQNLDLQRVYDLIAFRIIVDSIKACYEALGMIHDLWEPVPGRFKDYISKPKSNMYQSLHTTVIGPYGERMEVQIRTEEMNRTANEGIAAHWIYKEGKPLGKIDHQETQRYSWLRELLEWNQPWKDPKAVFEEGRLDFYPDEVYVFTPQGDVKVLPRGSTPVDFAYEVHSEVGHRCVGARVNGKLVPLRQELQNGDTIEILTSPNHRPSKDWLKFVKTSKALTRIRHWIKAEERERSLSMGREVCEREFRKKGLNFGNYLNSPELLEAARSLSFKSVDDLLANIGYRKISPTQVIGRLPSLAPAEPVEKEPEALASERRKTAAPSGGIKVRGADDVLVRMARCCNPVPGERIVGYITRGRGITVHHALCRNLSRGDSDRRIEVEWDSGKGKVFPVDVKVVCAKEKGMLAGLSGVLGQLDANILDVHLDSSASDATMCLFKIEVKDNKHLQRVLLALKAERGVYQVQRSTL